MGLVKVEMKQDVKEKWISLLRSGEHEKATWMLFRFHNGKRQLDVLGVLVDLYLRTHNEEWAKGTYRGTQAKFEGAIAGLALDNDMYYLPKRVQMWAELESKNPILNVSYQNKNKLAEINDLTGLSLSGMADLIEKGL